MSGSISDFKSSFKGDLARPNHFDVSIPVPITLLPYMNDARRLNMRCESAELPSRTFMTTELKTYGPVEKYPYHNSYTDITLTFIVDDNMREKLFFDAWMDLINPQYNNHFKYKGDYATPITISQYDVTNEASYSIDLVDAFPISMSQMELNWASDGYHRISVVFAFTSWKNNSLQALGMSLVEAGIGRLVDSLGGLGGNAVTGGLGTAISGVQSFIGGSGGNPLTNMFGGGGAGSDNPLLPKK